MNNTEGLSYAKRGKSIISSDKNEKDNKNIIESIEELEKNKYIFFIEMKKEFLKHNKDFKFKNGLVQACGDDFIFIPNESKKKTYYLKNSRYIMFINKKINKKKIFFIHDENSFKTALNEIQIEKGILEARNFLEKTEDNYDSNNSNSSSSSIKNLNVEDILDSIYDSIIEENISIITQKIFNIDNFNKRFSYESISELDFNFKYIKKEFFENKSQIEYIGIQNEWIKQLKVFYRNNFKKILFIFGPKGVGKTTVLFKYFQQQEIPRLYFSIKGMFNIGYKKWKKICLYESLYTFNNINDMNEFEKFYKNMESNYSDLIEFIMKFINFFIEFYISHNKKPLLIVLDDYNDLYDANNNIKNLIDYVNNNANKILLCILGEGIFIREKLYNYFSEINYDYFGEYWTLNINQNPNNKFLNLPLYYYKYNNMKAENYESIIKLDIKNEFQKIDIKFFLLLNKYLNSDINIKNLKDYFGLLPIEFLTIKNKTDINNNRIIKLNFCLDAYRIVYEESIKGLLKIENLKAKMILNSTDNNQGKNGIDFEDILVEQLWNNTFDFIKFPEENKIKVKEIYELKNNEKRTKNNVNIKKPIIIRQTLFRGKFYDLLLIIEDKGKKYAIFIQIGLSKTEIQINTYYKEIADNYEDYKKGIQFLIGNNIDALGFMLIFESEAQKKKIGKNNEGIGYCLKTNFDFLIYKDFLLYKNLNDTMPINSIKVTNSTLIYEEDDIIDTPFGKIKNCFGIYCNNFSRNDLPCINLENQEKTKILKYINEKYGLDYCYLKFSVTVSQQNKGFGNFGIIEKNNEKMVNIFQFKKKKFISYNDSIFKLDNLEKINEKEIEKSKNKNFVWELYFLSKKRKIDNE